MSYVVSGVVTISMFTRVEANSPEEAKRIAEERAPISLCHQCGGSREQDESWCTSGELDGEVIIDRAKVEE